MRITVQRRLKEGGASTAPVGVKLLFELTFLNKKIKKIINKKIKMGRR